MACRRRATLRDIPRMLHRPLPTSGWHITRWPPRAFCSRRCSSPSPAAPSPASTASSPPAPPPSSSTGKPRRSPSPTAACCIECLLAVISLCAVGLRVLGASTPDGAYASPDRRSSPTGLLPDARLHARTRRRAVGSAYALLVLAVSVFCLTSLDTATRLGRYMFQELFDAPRRWRHERPHRLGARSWRTPMVATIITVVHRRVAGHDRLPASCGRCSAPPTSCWPRLALLAVCAWLGNAGQQQQDVLSSPWRS